MEISPLPAQLGSSLSERIGSTPLIRLEQPVRDLKGITLLAKAEWANPGGSVKDRAAYSIVADGLSRGLLGAGKVLLDATSGNTGIAFAMLGAALGFEVHYAPAMKVLRIENARVSTRVASAARAAYLKRASRHLTPGW